MKKSHVYIVFGTRPEAIKLAPVIAELRRRSEFEPTVVFTAQHRDLVAPVLSYFDIEPDVDFNIMQEKQSPAHITAEVLRRMESLFTQAVPDCVVVQGDTTTAMSAALAAFYRKIPVVHVEAGLRSGDRFNPFPEEMNRRHISLLASLHCAPTLQNRQNLVDEHVPEESIVVTGNPVIDALLSIASDKAELPLHLQPTPGKRLLVLTTHRRENFGTPQQNVFRAIGRIVEQHSDIEVIFPVHPNPSVRDQAYAALAGRERIRLVDPPDYITFVRLINKSYLVLTDSGGVQEEAPALGKPVVVLRSTTERPEIIALGNAVLAGTEEENIVHIVHGLLVDTAKYERMARPAFPYGNGTAAQSIADAILRFYRR